MIPFWIFLMILTFPQNQQKIMKSSIWWNFDCHWFLIHFDVCVISHVLTFLSHIIYWSQCVILCWLTSWLSLLSICNHFFHWIYFYFSLFLLFLCWFFSLFFVLSHWKFSVPSDFRSISVGLKKKKWICVIHLFFMLFSSQYFWENMK